MTGKGGQSEGREWLRVAEANKAPIAMHGAWGWCHTLFVPFPFLRDSTLRRLYWKTETDHAVVSIAASRKQWKWSGQSTSSLQQTRQLYINWLDFTEFSPESLINSFQFPVLKCLCISCVTFAWLWGCGFCVLLRVPGLQGTPGHHRLDGSLLRDTVTGWRSGDQWNWGKYMDNTHPDILWHISWFSWLEVPQSLLFRKFFFFKSVHVSSICQLVGLARR